MCSSVCICFTGIFGFCLLNSGQGFLSFTQIPVKHLLATKCACAWQVCVQQVCMCMHVRVHVCYAALKLYAFLKFSLVETLLVATKWITCSSWKHFQGRGRAECQAYQMCSESVHNCADEVCIWCLIWKIMNGATHATNRAQSEQFIPRLVESRQPTISELIHIKYTIGEAQVKYRQNKQARRGEGWGWARQSKANFS